LLGEWVQAKSNSREESTQHGKPGQITLDKILGLSKIPMVSMVSDPLQTLMRRGLTEPKSIPGRRRGDEKISHGYFECIVLSRLCPIGYRAVRGAISQ
jgi:hypothetical protein